MSTRLSRVSRTSTRAATGLAKGGGGSPLDKAKQFVNNLTPQQKILAGVALVALIILIVAMVNINKANQYIPLFDGKLSVEDLREIKAWLIQHNITQFYIDDTLGVIYIHPKYHNQVYLQLRMEGYPHDPVQKLDINPNKIGITYEQFKAYMKNLNESVLASTIRKLESVADARVSLAIPERKVFSTEDVPAKATVFVTLKSGITKLKPNEVLAIRNMVANAIPELTPENVFITDQYGNNYSQLDKQDEVGMANTYLEIQRKVEQYYKEKIEDHLLKVLGDPGKFSVTVNVEMDWNKVEEYWKTYGKPGDTDTVTQEKVVKYTQEYKGKEGADGEAATKVKEEHIRKRAIDQVVKQIVRAPGTIKRVTASVLLDNLSEEQVRVITGAVKYAIGINEARGDKVFVASMPFAKPNPLAVSSPTATPTPAAVPSALPAPPTPSVNLYFILAALGVASLGVALVFFFKQQKVIKEKASIALNTVVPSTENTTKLSDLNTDKLGNVTAPAETSNQTATATATMTQSIEELKKVAKENPTEIAELLRQTWLSEGK